MLRHLAKQLRNSSCARVDTRIIRIYFQPWCQIQESFNSLTVLPVEGKELLLLSQITISLKHEVKGWGVYNILKALPRMIKQLFIIFIILEDRIDNYRVPQNAPADDDLTDGKYKYTIKQFWPVFHNNELLSIVVPKPRVH